MRGRFVWVAVIAAIALCAAPAAAQAPRAPVTDVRVFEPFSGGSLASGLTAGESASGQCFAASLASQGRPDAWRCMAGNLILDPCFESWPPGSGRLACAASPWSWQVRPFKAAGKMPEHANAGGDLLSQMPWGLELADGARCTFLTGATAAVAGMRVNYGCENHANVVGDINRQGPLWRVFEHPASGAVIRLTGVLVAWY